MIDQFSIRCYAIVHVNPLPTLPSPPFFELDLSLTVHTFVRRLTSPHLFRQTNPNLGMSISISCFLSFFKEKGLVTLEHSWKVDDERVRSPHLCFYFLTGGRGALV